MTAYEQTKMLTLINRVLREWEHNAASRDLEDRHQWAMGVVWGIKQVIYALHTEFKQRNAA